MRSICKRLLAIAAILAAHTADADLRDPLQATLIVEAGQFFVSSNTQVRVDSVPRGHIGTALDFDRTFGLSDPSRFRVDAMWRFADRHAIRSMYFHNDRDGTRSLNREIAFGNRTFALGASAKGRSKMTAIELIYDYALVRNPDWELAGSIGAHLLDVSLGIEGAVVRQGSGSTVASARERASTSAPLPVLGLRGTWRLPHELYLTAQAHYISLRVHPYSGSLIDLEAALQWQASDRFGIGIGYNDFRFRFDLEDEDEFTGRLHWDYAGVLAFAYVSF